MPFTPLHFGPALLVKSVAPRRISFLAFAAAQVAIDIEPLVQIARGAWPLHAQFHSLLLGTAIGTAVGLLVPLAQPLLRRVPLRFKAAVEPEVRLGPALAGGLLGGVSHAPLDALMHADLKPFWPFSDANPLLDAVGLVPLHLACILAGALGAILLWWQLKTLAAPAGKDAPITERAPSDVR